MPTVESGIANMYAGTVAVSLHDTGTGDLRSFTQSDGAEHNHRHSGYTVLQHQFLSTIQAGIGELCVPCLSQL